MENQKKGWFGGTFILENLHMSATYVFPELQVWKLGGI